MTNPTVRKVCVVIPGFGDGGAQKQCIFLLNEISKISNLDVTLVHFHAGIHDPLLDRERLSIVQMNVSSNYDPRNVLKLRTILLRLKPDILMTWLHNCDVLGFFMRLTLPDIRWLMTERDSHYPLDPRFVLRRILGKHADAIAANSLKGLDYWRRAGAKGELHVVPNIVHPFPTDAWPGSRRISIIGRLEPQKNARSVVRAFCHLAVRRTDLIFAVIGQGSESASLQAEVHAAGLDSRIAFFGFRDDVAEQISKSELVVSMSHHEGLPNVMLESVACKRLVVASDIPEHRELLGDEYPYLVAARDDPAEIAGMIELALRATRDPSPLAYAQTRLAAMLPATVAQMYQCIFERMIEAKE